MSEDMFYGYTIDQIRQMDVWFRKQNLSWEILDQKVKEGFDMGVKLERSRWEDAMSDVMERSRM